MPRSLIGPLSASVRREDLPRSTGVGLLLAALLINALGLYGTSSALSSALEPKPIEKEEKVTNFDLVDPEGRDFVSQRESNDRPPEDTNQLGEVDNSTTHETKAPKVPNSDSAQQTKPGPQRDPSETADGHGNGQQGKDGERDGDGTGQEQGAGDDTLHEAYDGATATQGGEAGNRQGQPDPLAMLGGSPSVLDKTFGRPSAPDQMRDVDEGVDNVLQSKRHLYASFFNRLRDQVADQWRPQQAHQAADPSGSRYGDATRTTIMMVRLDGTTGKVLQIVIEKNSGAPHLDEEAERAMRAAAPFPNIPEGLADERGYVEFRFGFILDFNGGSRIFRYN